MKWQTWEVHALKYGREVEELEYSEIRDRYLTHRSVAALRNKAQTDEYEAAAPVEPDTLAEAPTDREGGLTQRDDGTQRLTCYLDPGHPTSLEGLLEAYDVDTEAWKVTRHKVNSWPLPVGDGRIETGWQVKATLEPREDVLDMRAVVQAMKEDAAEHAPDYTYPAYDVAPSPDEDLLLELDVFDHHFGMLAWGAEVGGESYDLDIATDLYMRAFDRLAGLAEAYPVSRILVPLGNDLLHYDSYVQDGNKGPSTTRGTLQDVDSRRRKLYVAVRRLQVAVLDRLRLIAPVDVVCVSGNHDEDSVFTLGDSLECWYRNDGAVEVDNEPTLRKSYRWGKNLIGFTHGHEEKHSRLPMLMATEWSEDWSETEYREWHVGHKHRTRNAIPVPLEDHEGVLVRELPSLCPPDSWHYRKGYLHRRASKAFLWHPEGGPQHEFSLNLERVRA
jgi:hypothetical protein